MKPFLEILKKQSSTERRLYLLNYIARSLFDGLDYTTLFTLLDDKGYKRAKLEYDPSTTLYARDLDLGRKAAAAESWGTVEQINHLPHLWCYTLLRCSLTSRVDAYPDAAFLLLLRLGLQEQAERSAELLTSAAQRARVFSLIGGEYALRQVNQSVRLFEQAYASAQSIVDERARNDTLSALGQACIQGNQFSLARRVVMSIEDSTKRTEGLRALSQALAQVGQWAPAREAIALLEDNKERNMALEGLAQTQVLAGEWQLAWEIFTTIEDSAEKARALSAFGVVAAQANDLQIALQVWREALRILLNKEDSGPAVGELAKALLNTGDQEAVQLWMELKEGITSIKILLLRDGALYEFCQSLIQLNMWPEVMEVINSMQTALFVTKTLSDSGQGLVAFSEELTQAGKEEDAARIRDLANQIWQATYEAIATLEGSTKATALNMFGESLMHAHLEQEALQAWRESRDILLAAAHDNLWDSGQLSSLSKHLAQAGHREEALDILKAIDDSEKRDKEYYELLKVLLTAQEWQIARNVSHTIQRFPEKFWGVKDTYQALIQAHEWSQALEVIEEMRQEEHSHYDDNVLYELHKALAQAKNIQEAAQLWQEMQGIFAIITIRDSEQINVELRELVEVLAQSELWQAALDIVKSIDGYTEGSVAARELCHSLAKAHRWQEAREVAASIQKDSEQARALSELGLELVATGQRQEAAQTWQETQQALAQTTSSIQRAQVLRYLSLGLAQSYQWLEALEIIRMIGDDEEVAIAYGELGRELVLSGNENVAATAWQTARSIAANITNPNWRARALSEIGQAMVQARHEQEGQIAWQEAQEAIASVEDGFWRRERTNELAQKMIQTGLWREYISLLGNADTNNNKLGELGTKLIEAGKLQEALGVFAAMSSSSWYADKLAGELSRIFIQQDDFQEAREILDSITDNSQRIQALSEFGQAMARTHHELEARQILQEIRDLLTTIEDSTQESNPLAPIPISQRAKDLSILGQVMAQASYRQEALLVWQEARELIQTLADSSEKVKELSKIGLVMAQTNYGQEALLVWQEARAITSTIKEYSEKINTLSELGQTMAQANHEQEAWQVWQEALAIITSTDKRIAGVFDSLDETNMAKEQQEQKKAATRENYLKGARAMRKGGQMLAQDYQRQDLRELMGNVGEGMEAFLNLFMEPEERERTNMQGSGHLIGSLMVRLASNSVSPEALSRFSQVLAEAEHWQEAREVLMTIEDQSYWQDDAWKALARSLTRAEHWQEACDAATSIKDSWKRISMQNEIVKVLAQKKQWQLAWKTLATIEDADKRTEALRELSSAVMQFYNEVHQEVAFVYRNPLPEQDMSPEQERQRTDVWHYDEYLQLFTLLLQVWTAVTTSEEALAAFPLAHGFVQRGPELGKALAQSFTWVSDFLQYSYE